MFLKKTILFFVNRIATVLFHVRRSSLRYHAETLGESVVSRVMKLLFQQLEKLTEQVISLNAVINQAQLVQEATLCRKDEDTHSSSEGEAGEEADAQKQEDSEDSEEEIERSASSSSSLNVIGESVRGRRRLMLQLPGLNVGSDIDDEEIDDDEIEKMMKVKQMEVTLGNLIVFIRRLCVNKKIGCHVSEESWVRLMLRITGENFDTHLPNITSLRTRVLALTLLKTTLPEAELDASVKEDLVSRLFHQLGLYMWVIPVAQAQLQASKLVLELNKHIERLSSPNNLLYDVPRPESPDENMPVHEIGFDPEKSVCCVVESGHTLVHGTGGRGYGLASSAITSGCIQWKFLIVKESRGYEGTCIGVSKYPVRDYSHHTTSDMWLYRAYSGNLYHNGEMDLTLPGYTQGDYITVVLDMEARTLSFGKNGEEPRLAFENIDATELYPCVMFYSTNPGEKVKLVDMQVRGSPKDLDAGEPFCAPQAAVMCESHVTLIRELHESPTWNNHINNCIIKRITLARDLLPLSKETSQSDQNSVDEKKSSDQSTSTENILQVQQENDRRLLDHSGCSTSDKSDEESIGR